MTNSIILSPTGYQRFIKDIRREFAGNTAGNVTVKYGASLEFSLRRADQYIIAFKTNGVNRALDEEKNEGHYHQMGGGGQKLSKQAIATAFDSLDASRQYDEFKQHLRIGCLVISEAARSQVVYRACQRLLHGHANNAGVKVDDFDGLAKNYNHTRKNARHCKFAPLDMDDYGMASDKPAVASALTNLVKKLGPTIKG